MFEEEGGRPCFVIRKRIIINDKEITMQLSRKRIIW